MTSSQLCMIPGISETTLSLSKIKADGKTEWPIKYNKFAHQKCTVQTNVLSPKNTEMAFLTKWWLYKEVKVWGRPRMDFATFKYTLVIKLTVRYFSLMFLPPCNFVWLGLSTSVLSVSEVIRADLLKLPLSARSSQCLAENSTGFYCLYSFFSENGAQQLPF